MALSLPRLDDRNFDQLVSEGQAIISSQAPGWTDHNLHDPGITMIDLFAWLAEMDLYRLDRVVPASYRAFLRLLGLELTPPRVAATVLLCNVKDRSTSALLSARSRVASATGETVFQTQKRLEVSAARLVAVLAGKRDDLQDRTRDNETSGRDYLPFGAQPQLGDGLYLGFDKPLFDDRKLISLYVWTPEPLVDHETRKKRVVEYRNAGREVAQTCAAKGNSCGRALKNHYRAETIWEYYAQGGVWKPLAEVRDKTLGLSLSGFVGFAAPAKAEHAGGGVETGVKATRYFIRCRLAKGGYDCAPVVERVALNAVAARHALDVKTEERSIPSLGLPHETFRLSQSPVIAGSTELTVTRKGIEAKWSEALEWDRIGPHDLSYVLSPESGEITFGDGKHGRVPAADGLIKASYQRGGGTAGNVPPGTLKKLLIGPMDLEVSQPFAAFGGVAAETLSQAKARAVASISESHRAITLADFERLALATPGLPVARAYALADYHPSTSCMPVAGCVTVVVLPRCVESRPEPSAEMLRAVACYLDRRRTLTNEVHVVGPSYTTVSVSARLHTIPGADATKLVEQAHTKLERFFHPLFGGPDEKGWPFGRDVYRTEVMAVLSSLPGVTHVDEVSLQTQEGEDARCGNLSICPTGLVASGRYNVTVFGGSHCYE